MHFARVVNFEDLDVQLFAYPGRNSQCRSDRGSWYHDRVSRGGIWGCQHEGECGGPV